MSETGLFRLLPRVIDVGSLAGSEEPFVYESTGHCDLYITLSHCWGNVTSLRTALKNIDEHRIRIPPEALSQIMIDAVSVTRYLILDTSGSIQFASYKTRIRIGLSKRKI
jgi:hypothetical protein